MIDPELAYAMMMERCVKQGIELERERIINLLESTHQKRDTYEMPMEYWVQRKAIYFAIALIKGDNNAA